MDISDLLSIGAVVAAVNAVLGYWAKSRIEGSIKHEYDRKLEDVNPQGSGLTSYMQNELLYSSCSKNV
jgi:hypothetical protein